MFLGSASYRFSAVRTLTPVITGNVTPLQDALVARETLGKFINWTKDNITASPREISGEKK